MEEKKLVELISLLSAVAAKLKFATATDDDDELIIDSSGRDSQVKETRALVSELCRHFYSLGWVYGSGGSVSIKVHEDNIPRSHQLIVMSPSGFLS